MGELNKYTGKRLEGYNLACELIRHGASVKQISESMNLTTECIYGWKKRIGMCDKEYVESYSDPDEMQRKLELLKNYKGVFGTGPYIENKEEKMEKVKDMIEKGYSATKISEEMEIHLTTVRRWIKSMGLHYDARKQEKELPKGKWVEAWCKEWDDFMKSLKRPLTIKEVDK